MSPKWYAVFLGAALLCLSCRKEEEPVPVPNCKLIKAMTDWTDPATGQINSSSSTTYEYNRAGQLVQANLLNETTGNGNTTRYRYGSNGNLAASATYADGKVGREETYDADGRLVKSQLNISPAVVDTYEYDGQGRKVKYTQYKGDILWKLVTNSYDDLSRLVRQDSLHRGQSFTTTYAYSPDGSEAERIFKAHFAEGFAKHLLRFNAAGKITAIVSPDTGTGEFLIESFRYNASGALTERIIHTEGVTFNKETHQYDAYGNKTLFLREGPMAVHKTVYEYSPCP